MAGCMPNQLTNQPTTALTNYPTNGLTYDARNAWNPDLAHPRAAAAGVLRHFAAHAQGSRRQPLARHRRHRHLARPGADHLLARDRARAGGGEPMYSRFFAFLSLFAAAMLTLVVADNLLLLFIGWEVMGLCSYLLIGFWYARQYGDPRQIPPRQAGVH